MERAAASRPERGGSSAGNRGQQARLACRAGCLAPARTRAPACSALENSQRSVPVAHKRKLFVVAHNFNAILDSFLQFFSVNYLWTSY